MQHATEHTPYTAQGLVYSTRVLAPYHRYQVYSIEVLEVKSGLSRIFIFDFAQPLAYYTFSEQPAF